MRDQLKDHLDFNNFRGLNAADPIHDKDVVNLRSLRYYVDSISAATVSGVSHINVTNVGTGFGVWKDYNSTTNYYEFYSLSAIGPNLIMHTGDTISFEVSATTSLLFPLLSAGTATEIISGDTVITIRHTLWESGQTGFMSVQLQHGNNYTYQNFGLTAGKDGYNNSFYSTIIGGSANTINTLSNYGIIGAGRLNNLSGFGSSILSGLRNKTYGDYSSIINGVNNNVFNTFNFVGNGMANKAYTTFSSILNGNSNTAKTEYSTIINGSWNLSVGKFNLVGNGYLNKSLGRYATVVNGLKNSAFTSTEYFTTILNGKYNLVNSRHSNILNGSLNTISTYSNYGSINNGSGNTINSGYFNTVINGIDHLINNARRSSVDNGLNNTIQTSAYSSIKNGERNRIFHSTGSTILNGQGNSAQTNDFIFIGNGINNLSEGEHSSILNGIQNKNFGTSSSILAGDNNVISGNVSSSSVASGIYMSAISSNTMYFDHGVGRSLTSTTLTPVFAEADGHLVLGSAVTISATATTGTIFPLLSAGTAIEILCGTTEITIRHTLWESGQTGYMSVQLQHGNNYTYQNFGLTAGKDGYNNSFYSTIIGGSANTINTLSNYGIIGAGRLNNLSGFNASILSGLRNKTYGDYSSIINGVNNNVFNTFNFIGNGISNKTHTTFSSILNGNSNTAKTEYSTIINGSWNYNNGKFNLVGNGYLNKSLGRYATIVNGLKNSAFTSTEYFTTILNGKYNLVNSRHSNILNGNLNTIFSGTNYSQINNGSGNTINSGYFNTITNGIDHVIYNTRRSFINNGLNNTIQTSAYSSISNGQRNRIFHSTGSTILNGQGNSAQTNDFIFIGDGINNISEGEHSSILNGISNTAKTIHDTIINGKQNYNTGNYSFIGNGLNNYNNSKFGIILNGTNHYNRYSSFYSTILNGSNNGIRAYSTGSTILNGKSNIISYSARYSVIGTGLNLNITGNYAIILNGVRNSVSTAKFGTIVNGIDNKSYGYYASTLNGVKQLNFGVFGVILNGSGNTGSTNTKYSIIGNGVNNIITFNTKFGNIFNGTNNYTISDYSIVGSGKYNVIRSASSKFSNILNGSANTIPFLSNFSTISNGNNNILSDNIYGFIGSGLKNSAITNSFGVILNGAKNKTSGLFSTILNGSANTAVLMPYVLIEQGRQNYVRAYFSTIENGLKNSVANGAYNVSKHSTIQNGSGNSVYGSYISLENGIGNNLQGKYGFLGSGKNNRSYIQSDGLTFTLKNYLFIGNGLKNKLFGGDFATIINGKINKVYGVNSVIVGGSGNTINFVSSTAPFNSPSYYSSIVNGVFNAINADYSQILNGVSNNIFNNTNPLVNTYSYFSTIINGKNNISKGGYSTIINGKNNYLNSSASLGQVYNIIGSGSNNRIVSGSSVVILNGAGNFSHNSFSTILNGILNTATTNYSFIANGTGNSITSFAERSVILNGFKNSATTKSSVILNGFQNFVTSQSDERYQLIGNGTNNLVGPNSYASIINGISNSGMSLNSFIGSGKFNYIRKGVSSVSTYSAILNGSGNTTYAPFSTILNGRFNQVSGNSSTVIAGNFHQIKQTATRSSVLGGSSYTVISADTAVAPYLNIRRLPFGGIYFLTVDPSGYVYKTGLTFSALGTGTITGAANTGGTHGIYAGLSGSNILVFKSLSGKQSIIITSSVTENIFAVNPDLSLNSLTAISISAATISGGTIFSTAITTNNIISVSAETDYLTVNNNFTTPVGYVDQLISYQGNFQYDLSATTYYSGSTPLQDIIYNISSIASSAYTFSAGADNNLYVSRTGNTIEYGMNTAITVNSIYSLFHYNYGDFNNQGNFANVGTITTTELLSVNGLSGDSIFSGSSNLNQVFAGINHTHNFSAITNTAHTHNISDVTNLQSELNTKANLSGANFTVLSSSTIFSGSSELSTLFPYDVSSFRVSGSTFDRWYGNNITGFAFSTASLTNARLTLIPFVITKQITIDRFAIAVSTGTGVGGDVARLGIYNSSVTNSYFPTTLLSDFGTVPVSAISTNLSITVNQVLTPGLYYGAIIANSGPTLRAVPSTALPNYFGSTNNLSTAIGTYLTVNSVFGSLPSDITISASTITIIATVCPYIAYRVSIN